MVHQVQDISKTPIVKPLSMFPRQLGQWHLMATRSSGADVVGMLGVDDYIDYNYSEPANQGVNLYVAFYDSVGNGKGYHSPKNCIPGGGWGIDAVKTVTILPADGRGPVTVSEMIIRNRNEYQVVLYWFQNRGRIIASEYWEKIFLVWDAIVMKRRDGSFVRVMVSAPGGDIEQAEKTLQSFAGLALSELNNFLPGRE